MEGASWASGPHYEVIGGVVASGPNTNVRAERLEILDLSGETEDDAILSLYRPY